jgi:hypothetical protein
MDLWHLEKEDNVRLCQGHPKWNPEVDYADPVHGTVGYPTVYKDESSGGYRLLYCAKGHPMQLMAAESRDGVLFEPMSLDDVEPEGGKVARHHIFTVPSATGSQVYIDPVAADGRPFKIFVTQKGGVLAERAAAGQRTFHDETSRESVNPDFLAPAAEESGPGHDTIGHRPYLADDLLATSADGLRWRLEPDVHWGRPFWHPEAPIDCYYNPAREEHVMVTRPGWGDRRVAVQATRDFQTWTAPELLMQPDALDPPLTQFYAMPVLPYEGHFIGFLWTGHFANSERLDRYNQMWGTVDSQLTYSYDGVRFQRGLREPFIPNNEIGMPGAGIIYPTCMLERDGELWIYSASRYFLHGSWDFEAERPKSPLLLHTMRRDGFTYLASRGHWASFTTKPMILHDTAFRVNVQAPHGELHYQISDVTSRPFDGFAYEDCVPFRLADSLSHELAWKHGRPEQLKGKVVRLEMKFRNARIYAVRGDFHFADANDRWLATDGHPIDTSMFDF